MNAALNQTGTLDRSIDDVLEHFVYLPKQSPVNPQDIPFFLSTRLDDEKVKKEDDDGDITPQELSKYEQRAAQIAQDFEDNMVRF